MAAIINQRRHFIANTKALYTGAEGGNNPHYFHAGRERRFMLVLMLVAAHQDIGKTNARGCHLNQDFPRFRSWCLHLHHAEGERAIILCTDKSAHS